MRVLIIVLLLAAGGIGCSSGGIGVDQDSGITDAGILEADAGVTSSVDSLGALVRSDGNSLIINPIVCAPSRVMTSCQATDTHYAFDGNQGKCVAVSGCDATSSLFDTLTSCEVECVRFLKCSCDSIAGIVDGGAGVCGNCPTLSMDSFLPNSKATVISGQLCTYAGLNCFMSSGGSSASWVCTCGADGIWSCVTPPSGCQLC